jgi:hypothetical protein
MRLDKKSRLNADFRSVGQGFTPDHGPRKLTGAFHAAEKLVRAVGRDFSPGTKPAHSMWALAPEVCFLGLPQNKSCLLADFGSEGELAR